MAIAQAKRRHPTIPPVGSYLTDIDSSNLYRIEALHRKEGVVIEDCRTCRCFMLTTREYQKQGFKVLGW
jgi:hypothetical protein